MAKYLIYEPCYVQGKYLGQFARPGDPGTIEVPDDLEPSRRWVPLDEAAAKALLALARKKIPILIEGLDPVKDKARIERITADTMKSYVKEIPKFVEKKAPVREVSTMAEMAESSGGKVVGRNSDKSPV